MPLELRMYDVFISHSSSDKLWVRELAQKIDAESFQGRPLRSWFDERELGLGDQLRSELEEALEQSRYLVIVLSRAAVASKWVRFEWDHWLTRDPKLERVLPLVLEDCEIPIKYADLIKADFRKPENFSGSFGKLLDKVRRFTGPDTDEVAQRAVRLLVEAEERSNADELYSYLSMFNFDDLTEEGLIFSAFAAMLDHLVAVSSPYTSALIVAECLAALQRRSSRYVRLSQSWKQRQHWTVMLVEVRANSKLAEIALNAVDLSRLYQIARVLDGRSGLSKEDTMILSHLVRAIGKMRDAEDIEDMLESLCEGGTASRVIAAGAIGINPSDAGGIYYLSDLHHAPKRQIQARPPSDRLVALLLKLRNDPIPIVKEAAEQSEMQITYAWGGLGLGRPASRSSVTQELMEHQAKLGATNQPFAGRICKATTANMLALSAGLSPNSIVALTSVHVHDVYFYGAAGMLIPDQGMVSHQCLRLVNANVPFAMLPPEVIHQLPEGVWVTVDQNGLLRERIN